MIIALETPFLLEAGELDIQTGFNTFFFLEKWKEREIFGCLKLFGE